MKATLLFLAGFSFSIANSQISEFLNVNQIKARVHSGGNIEPSTNGTWTGNANLWQGGKDVNGQLHLAAQTFSTGDYWPGPLSTVNATTNSTAVNQYNRVWKLNKSDIDAFIANYANGNVQNGSYTPVADLLSWPGNGDMSQNQDVLLAPFKDLNGDMIYDPLGAGEYPLIKGDQAIFTVFNDNYLPHQSSGGAAIGVEIRLMAYAYGPCNVTAANPFLNYTTFYNYKIINRSTSTYTNTNISFFNDIDIGYYGDDFIGSDAQDGYSFTYNLSSASAPAVGVVQFKGPINITNNLDDNNNGTVDEPFEKMGLTRFMYYNNSLPGVPAQTTDPVNAAQYYQYMNGIWKDGTPLTCGGNGYGGTINANFAYSGNSNISGPCGASNWMESGTGSDKRFIMTSGPYTLMPGAVDEVEYAYITAYDSITNNPLTKLDADVQSLRSIYNSTLNQCLTTGIKEQSLIAGLSIFPNPTSGLLNISSAKLNTEVTIQVLDALGKVLLSQDYKEFSTTTINTGPLSPGMYVIKLVSGEHVATKKFVKE